MTVAYILAEKGRNVVALHTDNNVYEVLAVLADKGIGAVLITHMDDTIAGILSERDIVRSLAKKGAGILQEPAEQHMTKK